jgi:hypothetical protein
LYADEVGLSRSAHRKQSGSGHALYLVFKRLPTNFEFLILRLRSGQVLDF